MPLITLIFASLLLASPLAAAQNKGIINFQLENDTYFDQDQHYTNGLTVSYLPINTSYPKLSSWLREAGLAHEDKDLFAKFSFTHAFYTPEDIENPEPQPNDFPWAGHAYLGAKLSHHPLPFKGSWQMQQAAEVNLGIIGPMAGARFVQTKFHKLINSRDPKGWHNQLKNEPTAKLAYNLQLQKISALNEGLYFINQPEIGASLGSPFTHINTGWGIGVSNANKPINLPAIAPRGMTSSYFELADQLVWQIIFGLEQRLVIYNQFLDGQLIRSTSSSLKKKRLVHSVYLGTGISYGKWRVTLLAVDTGDEFKGQKESNTYATLGVAFYL